MNSVRLALNAGGFSQGTESFALRGDTQCWPGSGSVLAALGAMKDPRMDAWKKHETEFANKTWTRQCQGVASDGGRWFFTSNDGGSPAVYRLSGSATTVEKKTPIPRDVAGHVGDVDFFEGRVYVALEKPTQPMVFDADLNEIYRVPVATVDGHFSWCAINPWNRQLYTSRWDQADAIYAYHPKTGDRIPALDIQLDPPKLDHVQGGCFSPNGRVYLSSDKLEIPSSIQVGVHGYGLLRGEYLGWKPIEIHQGGTKAEETEGVAWGRMTTFGVATHVHLVLLDQDWPDRDDIYFKSYAVPDPSVA